VPAKTHKPGKKEKRDSEASYHGTALLLRGTAPCTIPLPKLIRESSFPGQSWAFGKPDSQPAITGRRAQGDCFRSSQASSGRMVANPEVTCFWDNFRVAGNSGITVKPSSMSHLPVISNRFIVFALDSRSHLRGTGATRLLSLESRR
jgi:hypothetical protein